MIYLMGSLRNPAIPHFGKMFREEGFEVFDDWFAAGPEADDKWRDYEKLRGRSFREALKGKNARHIFNFDFRHLLEADAAVLVMPAGKSAFLELGWMLGQGKRGYILLDNPERWDVMFQFATGVYDDFNELVRQLKADEPVSRGFNPVLRTRAQLETEAYGHGV